MYSIEYEGAQHHTDMRIKDDKVYEVSVYRPDADWWDAHRLGVATVRGARNLTDLFFKARKRIGGCNGEDT